LNLQYVGPLNIGALLAHKIIDEYEVPELVELEKEMGKFGSLPPFDIWNCYSVQEGTVACAEMAINKY